MHFNLLLFKILLLIVTFFLKMEKDLLAEAVRSIQRNSEQVLQSLIPSKVNPNATVFHSLIILQ